MILGLEIGMLVFGLIALIRGKFTLSKNKVVEGAPARLLGLLAIAPLPLVLGLGVLVAIMKGDKAERFIADNQLTITLIEAGIVILFAILVFGIGAAIGVPPRKKSKRKPRDDDFEDDEYDDDRPPRRRRRDDFDEDDDERPPRRR